MCDPWKQQVIWQKVVEKETLAYAEIAERNAARLARENGLEPKQLLRSGTTYVETHHDVANKGIEEFNARLPNLPIANSSTGTIHTLHARRAEAQIEGAPISSKEQSQTRKPYRHEHASRFLKRNVVGGFFST